MKKIIQLLILLLVLLPVKHLFGQERLLLFDGTYAVQQDCSMEITETISVWAEGIEIQRGIYRDIPLAYDYEGGVTRVKFEFLSLSRDGQEENYHFEDMDNGIRIYFGSEDKLLENGQHTYVLKYKVNHVIRFLEKTDDLYWNTNGTGWTFSVDTLRARVILPEGFQIRQHIAYTGREGEQSANYIVEKKADNEYLFITKNALNAEENLTFSVSWDKNLLTYPSERELFLYWLECHALWIALVLGIIIQLLVFLFLWMKYGIDPRKGVIAPQYDAPDNISPSEVYAIMHYGKTNAVALNGDLISLAAKGWITIQVQSENSYEIKQKEQGKTKLTDTENMVYNTLFLESKSIVIVKGSYNSRLNTVLKNLTKHIQDKHQEKYLNKRSSLGCFSWSLTFILVGLAAFIMFIYGGSGGVLALMTGLMIATNLLFGYLFKQPTLEGRKMMDTLAGLQYYIRYADKKRIEFNNPPDLNFETFERLLPYAIVLGLAKEWENKFDSKVLQEGYSRSGFLLGSMGVHSLASSISSMSRTISSASTPPSSSSGGSFSGGGGSSGGGGGGGGGGGW